MNKTELIAKVAEKTGETKVAVEKVVTSVFATITDRMYQEEEVKIAGFGSFTVSKRAERAGRNPQTGAPLTIAASTAAKFKPAKELKEAIQD